MILALSIKCIFKLDNFENRKFNAVFSTQIQLDTCPRCPLDTFLVSFKSYRFGQALELNSFATAGMKVVIKTRPLHFLHFVIKGTT